MNIQDDLKEIKNSEQKFRHLFEKSPTGIYITDRHGKLLNVNPSCLELLGYEDGSDMCGRSLASIFTSADDWKTYLELLTHKDSIKDFETRLRKGDDTIVDVKMTAAVRNTLTGKRSGYEGFITDTTDLKTKEKKLRETEEKYRIVLENSKAGIFMYEENGLYSYVNPELVRMLGYDSKDEIIGNPFWMLSPPEERDFIRKRGFSRFKGEFHPREYPLIGMRKDGTIVNLDMRVARANYLGKKVVVGNYVDVTKRKQAEAQIRNLSRKLIDVIEEERKALAYDLHDEFGQALTALKFNMEKLQKNIDPGNNEAADICSQVMTGITNLAETMRNITSRLRPDILDHLGLIPTLEWYVNELKKQRPGMEILFHAMGFKRRLKPDTEIALYRIFQESVNNTLKHSGADRIEIRLTWSHPKVIFTCRDNGSGFDVLESGFPSDDAMGIGLLSMKERTDKLNGEFRLKTGKNKGTLIRAELPLTKE